MRGWLTCVLLAAAMWAPLHAAGLTVHLVDAKGAPVADAVVTVQGGALAASSSPVRASATYFIDQKNETFIPYVQLLRVGDKVVFRNSDTTRHQVYSFSDIKKFEFTLRPGQSSPPLLMDKAGIAAVGCNIHDRMITYLFVSDAAMIAISDATGHAQLGNLAPGTYQVSVWHPQLVPGSADPVKPITIDASVAPVQLDFVLTLIPDPREAMDRDHVLY